MSAHSDRGAEFFSAEMLTFLSEWGVPAGNGQVERFNGIFWQTTRCLLADRQLPGSAWPNVLREALHCIRSLVSFSTNSTSHSLFFNFERNPRPLPNAISPGDYAWLRRHIRSKNDTTGEIIKLWLLILDMQLSAVMAFILTPSTGVMESAADTNQDASEESLTTPNLLSWLQIKPKIQI